MKITVHLTRFDLIALNWQLLFKLRANLYFMLALWTFFFVMMLTDAKSFSVGSIGVAAVAALVGVVVAMVICITINSLLVLVLPRKNRGILGRHDISLSPTEFREATDVNDSSYRWNGIPRIFTLRRCLIVQVTFYSAIPVPRRAFDSEQAYEAFCAYAEEAWRNARLAPEAVGGAGNAKPESRS